MTPACSSGIPCLVRLEKLKFWGCLSTESEQEHLLDSAECVSSRGLLRDHRGVWVWEDVVPVSHPTL